MKNIHIIGLLLMGLLLNACNEDTAAREVVPQSGLGGSMAQFTIYNGQLFLLESDKLHTYSLQDPANPVLSGTLEVGADAETLFPYQGNLFVGSQNGMHIFSLSKPQLPQFISTFTHITSCDPVVVEGNTAYVTLRTGTSCRFGENVLQIVNIEKLDSTYMTAEMPLFNPQGLAVHNGMLYVCNGDHGLAVINVEDPQAPVLVKEYPDFHGYDVIFTSKSLMMVGKEGLVQFDPKDPENLRQLSVIPVEPLEE